MTLPFTLPDWVPWWVPVAVLVPGLLYALAFLFMPFSVIGLKGRLESIEARLDELQAELRGLVLRLPEPLRGPGHDEMLSYAEPERPLRAEPPTRPPIPPAPLHPDQARARSERAEPRLDWPR